MLNRLQTTVRMELRVATRGKWEGWQTWALLDHVAFAFSHRQPARLQPNASEEHEGGGPARRWTREGEGEGRRQRVERKPGRGSGEDKRDGGETREGEGTGE